MGSKNSGAYIYSVYAAKDEKDYLRALLQGYVNITLPEERNAQLVALLEKEKSRNDLAAWKLAVCLLNGTGCKADPSRAVSILTRLAWKNLAPACNSLGMCYDEGKGVEQSDEDAVRWYRRGAEHGDAAAQNNLGFCYDEGQGVEQSDEDAARWYQKAAEQGLMDAQFNLGVCYDDGQGVEQSASDAARWYQKAATQGHVDAQFNLGYCYENGLGVPQSDEKAIFWYQKAAAQGDESALENLEAYREKGFAVSLPDEEPEEDEETEVAEEIEEAEEKEAEEETPEEEPEEEEVEEEVEEEPEEQSDPMEDFEPEEEPEEEEEYAEVPLEEEPEEEEPEEDEQIEETPLSGDCNVRLINVGSRKQDVITLLRVLGDMDAKAATALAESAPTIVKKGLGKDDADRWKEALEHAGAIVEILSASEVPSRGSLAGATSFNVRLINVGRRKQDVITLLRVLGDLDAKAAAALVESLPAVVKKNLKKEDAARWEEALKSTGAIVELLPGSGS